MPQSSAKLFLFYIPLGILLFVAILGGAMLLSTSSTTQFSVSSGGTVSSSNPERVYEEGKGTISGKILLEDGSPNTVRVSVHSNSKRTTPAGNSTSYGASHSAVKSDFSFEIQSGDVYLKFIPSADYAPAIIGPFENEVDGLIEGVEVVLRPGRPFELTVMDQQGNPIPDARVNGFPVFNGDESGSHQPAENLGEGKFLFKHLADTPFKVFIEAPKFQPDQRVLEHAWATGKQTLQLEKGIPTTGTVLNADEKPVANAKFLLEFKRPGHAYSGREIGQTDAEGKFQLQELESSGGYYGIIEAPNKSRVRFDDLQAGQTGLVYEIPPLRTLHGRIQGDLSQLHTRSNVPHVKVDQRYDMEWGSHSHGCLIYDYVDVVSHGGVGEFHSPGLLEKSDQVEVQLGPHRVEFVLDEIAPEGDILLEYNLDTGEKSITPYSQEPAEVE